ncbi:MAG TPA: hypothetical protein VFQ75_04325 [Candidatus Limnocylindrales bacterium]|jgi:hypothetical protein|nr:hypothetical protein [Candidatus Limnocylindrales bacterium]
MTERRDQPVTGDVIETGDTRAYSWEWSEVPGTRGRSRLPWFGIFLVVFGGLLLLQQFFPSLETAGSLLFLAIGIAFLVSWLINRGMGSLYLGAIITALAAPELLAAANVVEGAGVGTACLGVAFLFIAAVRALSGAGWGWQAGLGIILFAIGASNLAVPGLSDLIWPIILVVLGGLLLIRAGTNRR